jgi:hypothetical protein
MLYESEISSTVNILRSAANKNKKQKLKIPEHRQESVG